MPQNAWSPKRERQYEHIKEGLLGRGTGVDKAEEIARPARRAAISQRVRRSKMRKSQLEKVLSR